MFFGRYQHTLDAAGRLILPARIRDAIDEQERARGYYLLRGPEGCIVVYTASRLASILRKLDEEQSIAAGVARDFERALGGDGAHEPQDKQGRVLIPEHLRKHAQIEKDVLVIGRISVIELWSPEVFERLETEARDVLDWLSPSVLR